LDDVWVLQRELVGSLDDIPEFDSVITTGTGQNVVSVGMKGDVADFSAGGLGQKTAEAETWSGL
jgi:hypothetical protein